MLQTSLLLMKSLNKIETSVFQFVVHSLFPKAVFLMFICTVQHGCLANMVLAFDSRNSIIERLWCTCSCD